METQVICFCWIIGACLMSITLGEAQTDVLEVQLGGSAILGCEISYHSETTWLKQRLNKPPLVLTQSLLNNGLISHRHRANARHQTQVMGQSLALNISFLEETDLGLYFCMGMENKMLKVGTGKKLKVTSGVKKQIEVFSTDVPGTKRLVFSHLYAALVGVGVIGMALAVVITHLRTESM